MREGTAMAGRKLDARAAESAVLGSAILGGGSSARTETGIRLGQMATELGDASLVAVDDLPPEARIVAVATLNTRGAKRAPYRLSYHHRAIDLLALNTGTEFAGLTNFGSGALDMMISWGQAALLGIPLVDAGFDGQGHPNAVQGFIDLLGARWPTIPVSAVGRDPQDAERSEMFLQGSPRQVMHIVRCLMASGVSYAVCVGPLPQWWMQQQAMRHQISRAMEVGEVLLRARGDGGRMVASAVSRALGGEVTARGAVTGVTWKTGDGVARGTLLLRDEEGHLFELTHRHRYVALDLAGRRIAAFPDLIVTLGAKGTPLHARELTEGQDVYIVVSHAGRSRPLADMPRQAYDKESARVRGEAAVPAHGAAEGL
jgi:DUF917 family protein